MSILNNKLKCDFFKYFKNIKMEPVIIYGIVILTLSGITIITKFFCGRLYNDNVEMPVWISLNIVFLNIIKI